ncbi:hypothetical protein CK203_060803 [Vitis vinifera]|uniref:Uncharacterized protein n=1 Tax=Vitis vinifera TaxID=29760 RepID=A0A438GAM2_VITVI|nr:hypothetical protein CK203_060803 [Vitis vinifera]
MFLLDALLRHNIYPLQHMVQKRGALLETLFRISEGFFFVPHHLIMTALLYFEDKVYRKKPLRADAIPLLFRGAPAGPEHLEIPQLEHPKEPHRLRYLRISEHLPCSALYRTYTVQRLMSYFADIDRYSEHPCPADGGHTSTSGSTYRHPDPAYCHP